MEAVDKEPTIGEMIERAMCDLHDAWITLFDQDVEHEKAWQNMEKAVAAARNVQSNTDPSFWLAAGGNMTGTDQVHELGALIDELESAYPELQVVNIDSERRV